jgi:hypothetical protein
MRPSKALVAAIALTALACAEPIGPRSITADLSLVSGTAGVIDLSSHGSGEYFDPRFYRDSDGAVFPARACGRAGCLSWFVGFIQGDAALVGHPISGRSA